MATTSPAKGSIFPSEMATLCWEAGLTPSGGDGDKAAFVVRLWVEGVVYLGSSKWDVEEREIKHVAG